MADDGFDTVVESGGSGRFLSISESERSSGTVPSSDG